MERKKQTRYMIRVTDNVFGKRSIIADEFKTRASAKKKIRQILSPPKKRVINLGGKKKTIYLTSYRNAQSGTGLNNPRIIKREVYR